MHPKWIHKFELKPGKWIYHPSHEAIAIGAQIKKSVREAWTPPDNYFHLRSGGHVEALKLHLDSTIFCHLDIKDFFGSVNRSRITRSLKPFFGYAHAREMANDSTVQHPIEKGRYMLPYGFVQSPLLASLAFYDSALGRCLRDIEGERGLRVSVYVDDLVISGCDLSLIAEAMSEIHLAAKKSHFQFNDLKSQGPSDKIIAFNIEISKSKIKIHAEKLHEFHENFLATDNFHVKSGIGSYIRSVNCDQAIDFEM
jgi:hypothetical protein